MTRLSILKLRYFIKPLSIPFPFFTHTFSEKHAHLNFEFRAICSRGDRRVIIRLRNMREKCAYLKLNARLCFDEYRNAWNYLDTLKCMLSAAFRRVIRCRKSHRCWEIDCYNWIRIARKSGETMKYKAYWELHETKFNVMTHWPILNYNQKTMFIKLCYNNKWT